MRSVENPRVILITGIMAAGKSTVAQRLAERLDRSVYVRGDAFRRMIVSGASPITPGYGDWTVGSLDATFRRETPQLGLWLDTSDQTPDQTVDEILVRLPETHLT
jgi:cytidylate kinase